MQRSFRSNLIDAILENAAKDPKIVVLNADSARALQLAKFSEAYPDRMFNMGISEADMVSTAAGMATTGLRPIVVGFAMFVAEKPFEQVRQVIAYPNLDVKIVATHAGLCVGQDGASHQAAEDIAAIRSLPNFRIFTAADIADEKAAFRAMMSFEGPAYLRLGRDKANDIFPDGKEDVPGGSDVVRDGKDAAIVACGLMLDPAIHAAEELEQEGLSVAVINEYSIKPLDGETLLHYAKKTGAIVTAEDHSVIGGLGSAVSELTASNYPVPVLRVGVNDVFGESGTQDDLYEKYGLTAEQMKNTVKKAVSMKGSRC